MRSLLLFPILTLISICLQASTHIRFMGIEVNGTYQSFKDSLETKGFVYMGSFETMHKFYGKFANEIVTLEVLATPQSKTICKVIVHFPKKADWQELKKDYFVKKDLFKTKYPLDRDFEFFSTPYEDGDGYELRAVRQNKCRYVSFYLALGGHISVEIDKSAQITVTYEDRENIKIAQQELEQKAIDEI